MTVHVHKRHTVDTLQSYKAALVGPNTSQSPAHARHLKVLKWA